MFHSEYINPNKLINNDDIISLFNLVEKHGGVLRFVGGAVRDAIVGVKRTDIDLVTDMSPFEFTEMCADEGIRTVPIGIQFFTTGVIINDSFFKVTSLNSDEESSGDEWKKDAASRDLTINAVYADNKGNVFDYFDGIHDLERGIIKFIGNPKKTIEADYIRIMRFFRFCAMFGKDIDKKSLEACIMNKALLKQLSLDKIKAEFFKILRASHAVIALNFIFEHGILDFLIAPPKSLVAFERLKCLEAGLNIEQDIVRLIFVLFEPDYKRAQRLANIFILTKNEKDKLLALAYLKDKKLDFKDTVSFNKLFYQYGVEICRDIYLYKNLYNTNTLEMQQTLNTLSFLKIPEFPLSGKDLIMLNADKKMIGFYIDILKKEWFENGCNLNKTDLIEKYKTLLS